MQPFVTTYYDANTDQPLPLTEDIEAHDTYSFTRCAQDDSLVTFTQAGTACYATCEQGHRWQDSYDGSGTWIERP